MVRSGVEGAAGALLIAAFIGADRITRWSEDRYYADPVLYAASSPYQRIVVTRFTDAMPPLDELDPAEQPSPAMLAWLTADPPLPEGTPYANLNTAAFDGEGDHWFTGQAGIVGVVRIKCAWWLVTKTTRAPSFRYGIAVLSRFTCESRLSRIA